MANLKMEQGEAISAYRRGPKDIKEALHADVDVPMPSKVFLSAVLNGLPEVGGRW